MLGIIITLTVILLAALVDIYLHYHSHGLLPFRKTSVFTNGPLSFWALGDRVLIQEDEFQSGYECPTCGGSGRSTCDGCGGAGQNSGKKCSNCDGACTSVCPACHGKGGLLVIPEVDQRRPTSGTIVSAGAKCHHAKVGQSVLFSNFSGYVVDLARAEGQGNVVLRIIHETEILAGMSGQFTLTNLKFKSEISTYSS